MTKNLIVLIVSLFIALPSMAQIERGVASYYAKSWTGRRTANGERLHHDSLTCAHRTLPFGTMLKVTNLSNGKEVVVRVNDRGPFARGRIIDLSYGAAREIGMLASGITKVEVEHYEPQPHYTPIKVTDEEFPLMVFPVVEPFVFDYNLRLKD